MALRFSKFYLFCYLLVHWNLFLAPFWPYFLRSFIRGSRRRSPSFFNTGLLASLKNARALDMPSLSAPAWPVFPPPTKFAFISILVNMLVTSKGCLIKILSVSLGKYFSRVSPLTTIPPFPADSFTRAIAFLRLPVAQKSVFAAVSTIRFIPPKLLGSALCADAFRCRKSLIFSKAFFLSCCWVTFF